MKLIIRQPTADSTLSSVQVELEVRFYMQNFVIIAPPPPVYPILETFRCEDKNDYQYEI